MKETIAQPLDRDVLIVGAGPAGVGLGVLFRQLGFDSFSILERDGVGASFRKWPEEMKLITPSFHGHAFGHLDLNAVLPGTSPGYSLKKEHLSGKEYARYLQVVADHFELPVITGVEVHRLEKRREMFFLHTSRGIYMSRFVVWAAGEFQYPRTRSFPGAEYCLHNSRVSSWSELSGKERVVIGGYESGIDAAIHLSTLG